MKLHCTFLTSVCNPNGLFNTLYAGHGWLIPVILLLSAFISVHGANTVKNCEPRWIDSLVNAGKRSIDSGQISDAKRYFSIAYQCGMSKDSMLFFGAEIYMRAFELDTALTFNWGLEKNGHFSPMVYLEQRSRIFRMMGWNRQADSIVALLKKKMSYDFSMKVSASRNILTLNSLIIPPKSDLVFRPDDLIDDAGGVEIRNRVSMYSDQWLKRAFIMFNYNTDFRLPTRFSFKDESDTLIKSISFYIGAGELPSTPEFMVGYRIALHEHEKIDHFNKFVISIPLKRNGYASIGHDIKWSEKRIWDDRTDILLSRFSLRRKLAWVRSFSTSHHYTRFNQYENQSGLSGLYPMIPLGYTDSLMISDSTQPKFHYFRDSGLRQQFDADNPFLNEYWDLQPSMRLITQPEHDVSASFNSSWQFYLPLDFTCNLLSSLRCTWFPEKAIWFTVDDTVDINYFKMYTNYAVLFNSVNKKYYINKDRTQPGYLVNNFVELKKNEKVRIDYYFSIAVNIEKGLGRIGRLYFSSSYLKCFSTLPKNVPLITLNQNWEFQAGWKKDISITK